MWYQPKFNVMLSSEFGTPKEFGKGFDPARECVLPGKCVLQSW
jgi:hypothetical protein